MYCTCQNIWMVRGGAFMHMWILNSFFSLNWNEHSMSQLLNHEVHACTSVLGTCYWAIKPTAQFYLICPHANRDVPWIYRCMSLMLRNDLDFFVFLL